MRKASLSICRKYKSSAFHNVEDLNQLNPLKIISFGFACKDNEIISITQVNSKEKARSPAGFGSKSNQNIRQSSWKKTTAKLTLLFDLCKYTTNHILVF